MIDQSKYYRTPLKPEQLRKVLEKNAMAGCLQVVGHVTILLVLGTLFVWLSHHHHWVGAFVVLYCYGTVFSFLGWAGASHELQHHTVFKKKSCNVFWLTIFSFLSWGNPVYFRRAHASHHKYTLDSHHDMEVRSTVCLRALRLFITSVFDIPRLLRTLRMQYINARGVVPGPGAQLFPDMRAKKSCELVSAARRILLGHAVIITIAVLTAWWQLFLLVSVAAFIGNGLANLLATVQHCGMHGDTLDYRQSTRTIILPRFLSFLYWNMNYHIEHHMYPAVPCYNLPKLRNMIDYDLPPATMGVVGAMIAIREDRAKRALGDCSNT